MKINIDQKKDEELIKKQEELQKSKELEEFYTTGKITNMMAKIEERKKDMLEEIAEYAEREDSKLPMVITNRFLGPITPITSQEPQYTPEQLGMVYEYYCFLVTEINAKIATIPTSLTGFCRLAGITLSTLRQYKSSTDYNMRVVAEKIYDQIGDENLTMSQMGIANERSTIFKLKSQNEIVEKAQPNVNINVIEAPDMDRIKERIGRYKAFSSKRKG